MYYLLFFGNAHFGVYVRKQIVSGNPDVDKHVTVKHKGTNYHATVLASSYEIDCLYSIANDLENKSLIVRLQEISPVARIKPNFSAATRSSIVELEVLQGDCITDILNEHVIADEPNDESAISNLSTTVISGFSTDNPTAHFMEDNTSEIESEVLAGDCVSDISIEYAIANEPNDADTTTDSLNSDVTSGDSTGSPTAYLMGDNFSEIELEIIQGDYEVVIVDQPSDKDIASDILNNEVTSYVSTDNATANFMEENASEIGPVKAPRKRISKKHCCYFCGKLFSDIRKHWKARHPNEPLYKQAVVDSKIVGNLRNPRFHRAFDSLRKLGDAKFNKTVDVEDQKIIVRKYYGADKDRESLICPKCKGYFSEANLRYHKKCRGRDFLLGDARIESVTLASDISDGLRNSILLYLKKKRQRNIIFKDPVILHYGKVQYETLNEGISFGAANLVRLCADMRMLADLVGLAKNKYDVKYLNDLFKATEVNKIYDLIEIRCGFDGNSFKSPASAIACCNVLRKVLRELITVSTSQNKLELKKRYQDVYDVFVARQINRVSKRAANDRTARQRLKHETLPSKSEVMNLMEVLDREIEMGIAEFKKESSFNTYYALMKAILAKIMAFNRKRPVDVQRMRIDEFKSSTCLDDEYLRTLSPTERCFFENIKRIKTQHKLNQISSVLVTQEQFFALNLLLQNRKLVNISDDNVFVFATPRNSRYPFIRADDALQEICKKHNLNYSRLQSTKLRKHLATTTSKAPQDQQSALADFMAHSFDVHKAIYTITETVTDITTVGKLLFEANGTWCDQPFRPTEVEARQRPTEMEARHLPTEVELRQTDTSPTDNRSSNYLDPLPSTSNIQEIAEREIENLSDDEFFDSLPKEIPKSSRRKKIGHVVSISRTWRTPLKATIRKAFCSFIEIEKVPAISEVKRTLKLNKIRHINKNPIQIRAWIDAEIKRNRRATGSVNHWSTPQKKSLRERFQDYYDKTADLMNPLYPTKKEMENAICEIPDLKMKTSTELRSKLQHEFKLVIEKKSKELKEVRLETSSTSSDSDISLQILSDSD